MNAKSDDLDIIVLEADAANFKPEPMSEEGRKRAEAYLEKLRIYYPDEYEQVMKQREASKKRREAKENPGADPK